MKIRGYDTEALPTQFELSQSGRVLILDGDGPCYVAAATAKRLDTALRRFQQAVLEAIFMAGCTSARIHLTARDSKKFGRFHVVATKPYQGNRKGKKKPPLLEPLRELVANRESWLDEYAVWLHRDIEADDAMMRDAYIFRESGVIHSEDKDLRMTPWPYYDIKTGTVKQPEPVGWVSLKYTDSGTPKLIGHGPLFFWAQMLMGDTADNIAGLRKWDGALCGPVKAFEILGDVTDISDAANAVIGGYRAIGQNVVAEGWLLWLPRSKDDNVIKYMLELELTKENRDFVGWCTCQPWFNAEEVNDASEQTE